MSKVCNHCIFSHIQYNDKDIEGMIKIETSLPTMSHCYAKCKQGNTEQLQEYYDKYFHLPYKEYEDIEFKCYEDTDIAKALDKCILLLQSALERIEDK